MAQRQRPKVVLVGAALLATAFPRPAGSATPGVCVSGNPGDFMAVAVLIIGGIPAGIATLGFGAKEIEYAADGRWLPGTWAGPQIAIAGGLNLGLAGFLAAAHDTAEARRCGSTTGNFVIPALAISATLGVWFVVHGIVSLVLGDEAEADAQAQALAPEVTVTSDSDRFAAAFAWRF